MPKALRWLLVGLAAILGVLVVGSFAVLALGITISAASWRDQLADAMGRAIGREVRFEGPLEMQPTLTPTFRVGGITVANPRGFTSPFFATLGQATLRVDLLALLQGDVRVRELAANGATVHLERNAQAQVNWLFALARKPEAQPAQEKPGSGKPPLRLVAIDRIELKDLLVDYLGGPGFAPHVFTLDTLHGEAGEGKPLTIDMKGTVESRFPYTVSIKGGALSALTAENKPWPMEFTLEFLGTTLALSGSMRPDAARTSAELTVALGTEDLSQLERLLQMVLPPVGASGLSARVAWKNGVLDIRELRGVMGKTTLDGRVQVDITQAIPRVKGEFDLPVLDVTPFRQRKAAPAHANDAGMDIQALKQRQFEFHELALVDADLSLKVHSWSGIPGNVRDCALQVGLHDGVLKAPVMATVADVPVTGEIDLDGASANPTFRLDLQADKTVLGQLGRLLTGADGVQGRLGHFLLHFAGTGKNLVALTKTLEMKLEVADGQMTYGNVNGGKPVQVRLDLLDIQLPPGQRLQGKIRGTLLREPFTADFKGGDLPTLSEEIRWPVEINAHGSGATLHVEGHVAAPEKTTGTDVSIKLSSPRAGNVARWLGLSPKASAAVALAGRVRVESDEWHLSDVSIELGKTRLTADLARVGIHRKPLVQARLRVDNLELAELETILPPPKPGPSKPVIEFPILPQGIDLTDADVDVGVKRIALRPEPVTDITFLGKIREGRMYASPFSARYLGTTFGGAMALDLRGREPEATVWVAANQVDIGNVLRTLGLVQSLDVTAQLLQLQLKARGHRLGEMLMRSELLAGVESGLLNLPGPQGNGGLRIALTKGEAHAVPKEPVHVILDGLIDKTPVKIALSSGSVEQLLHASSHVPFNLNAEAAGMRLGLSGKVSLPISQQEVELELSVTGDLVSSLDELARTSLPHWGPYDLQSRFRVSPAGYDMPGLTLKVGSSELKGKGSVLTSGPRPKIDLQLTAPRVQLDDFKLVGWALAEKKPDKEEIKRSEDALRKKAKEASAQTEKVLNPEALGRQDVTLAVDVAQVLSGRDRLGGGSLRASLIAGKLAVNPAEVSVPGGSAKLWMNYFPDAKGISFDTRIRVDRFDYGVLARRFKPDSDLQGLFSLQVDLQSKTPSLDRLMTHGNGRIDFAVWPKNMKSGIFDLWAVNLFVALIPAVDPAAQSRVNCAVGRFDLKQGVLSEDSILMDTSRMRVTGKGRVDFDSESLSLQLAPRPKKAQFFSLATPVEVSGTLMNPKISVSAGAVVGTAAKFFTSIIITPLERIFSKEIPSDGNDVCSNALRQSRSTTLTSPLN